MNQVHHSFEIPIYPCKDSDAGIGTYYFKDTDCTWEIGIYFGKYLLGYNSKLGLKFADYFATGCGG